jgi:hypothetical protein
MANISAPFEFDRERQQLTHLLLRLPRSGHRLAEPLWTSLVVAQPELFRLDGVSPIVGVASEEGDRRQRLLILVDKPVRFDIDAIRVQARVDAPIVVIESGPFVPASRPLQGGDSISGDGAGGDTGTICCVVENDDGDKFVLGCNHTLAGVNRGVVNQDTVREPGAAAGGRDPADRLGPLVSYATIQLGGYHRNTLDAAIAEPTKLSDVASGVRGLGPISGVAPAPRHGDRVKKEGWATGYTTGVVRFTLDFTADFNGQAALFVGQMGIVGDDPNTGFAQKGDSGAPVLTEMTDELAGMVIAVAPDIKLAVATPIGPVLSHFDVEPAQ